MSFGIVLLADYLLVNPLLGGVVAYLAEYLVLLAAAAAIAGGIALARRHLLELVRRRGDRVGSIMVLGGMGLVLGLGLAPGSAGSEEPAVRWVAAVLLVPLVAALFALIPIFALRVARRGVSRHGLEATVMVLAAAGTLVLLLPLTGEGGAWLATTAGLLLDGPLAAVFRGLLIAIAVATAISAARLLFGIDATDD
jgi:hypothetical protein